MGYFSWACEKCSESLMSIDAEHAAQWETEGVALLKNGSIIRGAYDGFGRLEGIDVKGGAPTIYHAHCYDTMHETPEYSGESEGADDQGYFDDARRCEDCDTIIDEGYLCEDCESNYCEHCGDDWCEGECVEEDEE